MVRVDEVQRGLVFPVIRYNPMTFAPPVTVVRISACTLLFFLVSAVSGGAAAQMRRRSASMFAALLVLTACLPAVQLMAQDDGTTRREAQHVCMWNEAVCQSGNVVSIRTVATDSDRPKLDALHDVRGSA